jgi:hypothetical protein
MGEGISGWVSAATGTTQIVVTMQGEISPACLEALKTLIRKWAKDCDVTLTESSIKLKKSVSKKS